MLWVKLSWVELWVPQSLSANFCPIRQGCRRRSYNSVLQNFVAFIPSRSIRQIMANFSRIEFQSTSGKEKKIIVLCSRPPQNAVKTGLHAGVQWPQRILLSCRFRCPHRRRCLISPVSWQCDRSHSIPQKGFNLHIRRVKETRDISRDTVNESQILKLVPNTKRQKCSISFKMRFANLSSQTPTSWVEWVLLNQRQKHK